MGNGFFGHSICKYTNGMNALCMVASITNVTTMAFDASNAAKPNQDQGFIFFEITQNQFILANVLKIKKGKNACGVRMAQADNA